MDMREETERLLRVSLDCFSGADGGASFMKLRWFLEEMDKRAAGGDNDAMEVINVVRRFARLIELAEKA